MEKPMNPVYKRILSELEGQLTDIERRIVDALVGHPNGRNRAELVMDVFGVAPKPNISNDTNDRKNREAIASLFLKGVPIMSTSGQAGYWISWSENDLLAAIAESRNRIESEQAREMAAKRILAWLREARLHEETAKAIQVRLEAVSQMEMSL
jgi:hypothetical protein